jgi:nicotinamidase-related amidase
MMPAHIEKRPLARGEKRPLARGEKRPLARGEKKPLARDALVIIDMQAGSFGHACPPRHDADALVTRLNELARWMRIRNGLVVWVLHDGAPGDALEPGTDGWRVLPSLECGPDDAYVRKTACDSFLGTGLQPLLRAWNPDRVIITGWATDFCVDTTVRASTARGFATWAASDGHTVSDRPHLPAAKVIEHHNYVWANLIAPGGPVTVAPCRNIMSARGADAAS